MKTSLHYSSAKPVRPEPTNSDILKAIIIIVSLFIVGVLTLAGVDLVDQITLWLK